MLAQVRRRGAVIGFAILAVGVTVALGLVAVALNRITEESNNTRCAIVGLVHGLSVNSERNARATVASPSASPAQKRAARQNLDAIRGAYVVTYDALGHPTGAHCTAPPAGH